MIELPKTDTIKDSLSIEEKYYEPTNLVIIDAQVLLEHNPSTWDSFVFNFKQRFAKTSHTAKGDIAFCVGEKSWDENGWEYSPFIGVNKFRTEKDFDEPTYFDVYKIEEGKEWDGYCFDVCEGDEPIGHVLIKSGWIIAADADSIGVKELLDGMDENNYTIIPDFVGTIQASYVVVDLGEYDEGYCSNLDFYAADYTAYTVHDSIAFSDYESKFDDPNYTDSLTF